MPTSRERRGARVDGCWPARSPRSRPRLRYFNSVGETMSALLSISLVRDQDGDPLHFIVQLQDISERKLPGGAPAPPRRPRSPHRSAQPAPVRARPQAAGRPLPALRRAGGPDGDRSRLLQAGQRPARSQGRRRGPAERSRGHSPVVCGPPIWWPASAETSSLCCCPTWTAQGSEHVADRPGVRNRRMHRRRRRRRRAPVGQRGLRADRQPGPRQRADPGGGRPSDVRRQARPSIHRPDAS